MIACPVCRRLVAVFASGRVEHHADKVSTPCPMGGHHIPTPTAGRDE